MSNRYNNENHQRAAELHDGAAHAHLSAAVAHEKQDHLTGNELSRRALEHSETAYEQTREVQREKIAEILHKAPSAEEVAALAHQMWEDRGCPEGTPELDWFRAAAKLRNGKNGK